MTTPDLVAVLGAAIGQRIGEQRYQLWFTGQTKLTNTATELIIGVPNRFYQEWLERAFLKEIQKAAAEVLGASAAVRFEIDPALFQAARTQQAAVAVSGSPSPPAPPDADLPQLPQRRWLELRDFIVGPSNRLAHAAALSLVERLDAGPNPLTIHGPPGVGKTHLLEGMFCALRRAFGQGKFLYLTAEDFTNNFLHAMHGSKQLGPFRKQVRGVHALFVDDLHFLAGETATQEEFLHTFEALRKLGHVVAVTCVCHPHMLSNLMPELRDRLLAGGVWPIDPPDQETREAILLAKANRQGLSIAQDVAAFLAEQVPGNVRELEGALLAVKHYSQVHQQPITLAVAQAATGNLLQHAGRAIQLQDVERAVCTLLGIQARSLHSPSRAQSVSYPRMVAMYLSRLLTGASYSEIGRYFGRRNHSTVMAAEKKVNAWLKADATILLGDRRWQIRELVQRVTSELR